MDKLGKKKRARHSCWRANIYYDFKRGALLVHILVYILGGEKRIRCKDEKNCKVETKRRHARASFR